MPAPRIVTLLPSATEIVCSLGLRDCLVGVTHECDFPAGVENLPHVTRSIIDHHLPSAEIDAAVREHLTQSQALYHLDEALLIQLQPDIIVTQALCEVCAVSESEVQAVINRLPGSPQLVNLEPMTLAEVFDSITLVGEVTGFMSAAESYRASLQERVNRIASMTQTMSRDEKPTVGFLEWTEPLFNGGHWTPEIIELAGGVDSFGSKHQPSRTIPDETLLEKDPDVLIVAPCGFDAARAASDLKRLKQRIDFNQLSAQRHGRVHILDGNAYFSRPGPRLVEGLEALFRLLHPTRAAAMVDL